MSLPPILDNKHLDAPSVFGPVALLREARRQKDLAAVDVPPVCILDPDGDIVRRLKNAGRQNVSTLGPVTTPIFIPFRSRARPPASLHVLWVRLLQFWLPRNSLRADATS